MTYDEVVDLSAAAELVKICEGARTGVLKQLTCLSVPVLKRLIRDITGKSPHSGQLPYTTNWYEERRERLVHSSLFLRIFRQSIHPEKPRSTIFLGSYAIYMNIVDLMPTPWQSHKLDVNRAFLASQLFASGDFVWRKCEQCHTKYISVNTARRQHCHSCQLITRRRGAGGRRSH